MEKQQPEQNNNQPNGNNKIIIAIIIVAITIIVIMVFLTVDFTQAPETSIEEPSLTPQERGDIVRNMLGEDFRGSSPQERLDSTNVTNRTNPQERLDMFNN